MIVLTHCSKTMLLSQGVLH